MVFVSYIHVLLAAFLMGLAASAPMGPVNMMAVRRGVVGGSRHTFACGIGAIAGDLILFSLALLAGHYLSRELSSSKLQIILATLGLIVLLPVGIYFIAMATKDPKRAYRRARREWGKGPVTAHLVGEAAKALALTVFNPLTILYWLAVASSWLPLANSVLGRRAPLWGILMAGAGMTSWFYGLNRLVHLVPSRISAIFFRLVNIILGIVLIGLATFCAIALFRHLLR
jgi:threonine/homoserine/homoserine lactone efflux protein